MSPATRGLPLAPFLFALLILGLVGLWLLKPRPTTASQNEALPGDVRIVINGTDRTEALEAQATLPTNYRAPETLRLSDVSHIKAQSGQAVLVFLDGSELAVTPAVLKVLPGDIRSRLEYDRP